jgi:uncharacterized protein YycO
MPEFKVGDIFLTRNMGDDGESNSSPGYWNHAAIYVGNNEVVEAQLLFGVIKVKLENFQNRYPAYVVLRHKIMDGKKAADFAKNILLGKPYRKFASIFVVPRHSDAGENCVSVVRKCIWAGTGKDPGYQIPDKLYYSTEFETIEKKFDEKWQMPPIEDYWGIIKN